jgi:hypothetical protein
MQKRATSGAGNLLAQGWQDVQAPFFFALVSDVSDSKIIVAPNMDFP